MGLKVIRDERSLAGRGFGLKQVIAMERFVRPPHPPAPCSSGIPGGEGEKRIEGLFLF